MNRDDVTIKFITSSYKLLQNHDKRGRYFHTLKSMDNSPVVVHKETNQLTTVIKGKGKAVLNGEEIEICDGDAIFVEAGTRHQFIAEDELTLFHIHIPDEGRDQDRYIVEGEDYNRFEA